LHLWLDINPLGNKLKLAEEKGVKPMAKGDCPECGKKMTKKTTTDGKDMYVCLEDGVFVPKSIFTTH
jgi:hypothetical protein